MILSGSKIGCSGTGVGAGRFSAFCVVFHLVAGAFEHDGLNVVEQSIKNGAGDGGVAVENAGPLLEGFVNGRMMKPRS